MYNLIEGQIAAGSFRYAIIGSRFNDIITRRLIDGAVDCLRRHGADESQYDVILCPGSFEIPPLARQIAASERYDAVICVGAVIRGDTPHFDYVAGEVSKGIAQVALEANIPVIFGVLTTDSVEQALDRAGLKTGNKGWDAALAAMEMIHLRRLIVKKTGR